MNQQLQNLITLRDKVFPIVWEMDKQGRVDFNSWECGAHKCLKGWYCYLEIRHNNIHEWCGNDKNGSYDDGASVHFGLNSDEGEPLFSSTTKTSLQYRYNYLCKLIDERVAEERPDQIPGAEVVKEFLEKEKTTA